MSNSVSSSFKQPEEISIWVDIENKLKSRGRLTLDDKARTFSICRVPECIRRGDPDAYKPQVVSIGPYHHGAQGLEAMEGCKWRFLAQIQVWGNSNRRHRLLEECVDKLKGIVEPARGCYDGDLTMNIDREYLLTETTVVERDHSSKIEKEDLAMRKLTMENLTVKTERGDLVTLRIDRGELLMNTHKFVEMLLLDGCFLIGLLLKNRQLLKDPVFNNKWAWDRVALDVLLLENQLPLLVLETLFPLLPPEITRPYNLLPEIRKFFEDNLPENLFLQVIHTGDTQYQHLLHFIHMSLHLPTSSNQKNQTLQSSSLPRISHKFGNLVQKSSHGKEETQILIEPFSFSVGERRHGKEETQIQFQPESFSGPGLQIRESSSQFDQQNLESKPDLAIPSVTKLSGAGVEFERLETKSFLEVTFDNGKMKMGQLVIDDHTNRIFRNFIAFEQCLPALAYPLVFSNYCVFMDGLVNTSRDVEILQDCGMVENFLGSNEEVAVLFNKLGDGVSFCLEDTQYLQTTINTACDYTKRKWPEWRAKLVGDYFR